MGAMWARPDKVPQFCHASLLIVHLSICCFKHGFFGGCNYVDDIKNTEAWNIPIPPLNSDI